MKNRIDELIQLAVKDPAAFEKESNALAERVKKNKKLKEEIHREFRESLDRKGEDIKELEVKVQLHAIADMINMSYIAKTYFGKSRQWLNHRVNGAVVNGKPAKFTADQVEKLNTALQDISKKIGSVSVHH